MADPYQSYEAANIRNIREVVEKIKQIYAGAIAQLTLVAATLPFRGQTISLADYPALQDQIARVLATMQTSILAAVVNGITTGWNLANEKNDIIVDKRLGGKEPTETARQILYDPNADALREFIDRKEKGLNLSQRVYKNLELFGPEMERGLLIGIARGDSAASMTKDIKQYLKYPDKLFRRVREAEGKLQLSKAAQDFHPGQGVYRSSYKNALRLSRTETNIAYRRSDHTRWSQLPFIVGIDIHTSNNHPEYDICDELKGAYPKDFVFTGWHPQCICYQTPRLLTDAEYSKYEDQILGIGSFTEKPSNEVEDVPEGFANFLEKSAKRIAGWKSTPYWVTDNLDYTSRFF